MPFGGQTVGYPTNPVYNDQCKKKITAADVEDCPQQILARQVCPELFTLRIRHLFLFF